MSTKLRRQNFQTISWFSDVYRRGLLNLDPPYQRRSVWNQAYKDDFIDTILLQYPAPAIFLYEEVSPDGTSRYHVVDGKQRLTAVFEFTVGVFPVSETSPTHLRGKYFEQFSNEEKTLFWTYQFPIEYLPTNEEAVINTIFERINKNTAKLTRQELRHARFSGPFITVAEDMADAMAKILPEGFPRIESQSRKQMKDIELVANLLLFFEDGVRGYSQDELDEAFSDRDTEWEDSTGVQEAFLDVIKCLNSLVRLPDPDPLYKTRLRNQADFYSLFTSAAGLLKRSELDCSNGASRRLAEFVDAVEHEDKRSANSAASDYFRAARSNSNDTGPRKTRTDIMTAVLRGSLSDYTSGAREQVQIS